MREALYEDMPTMLVKILGIHAIKVQRKRTPHHSKSMLSRDLRDFNTEANSGTGGGGGLNSGTSVMSGSSDGTNRTTRTFSSSSSASPSVSSSSSSSSTTTTDDTGTTIYVIVQENLFHTGTDLEPPTTIFDLKGVLRFRRNTVVGQTSVDGGRNGIAGMAGMGEAYSSSRSNSITTPSLYGGSSERNAPKDTLSSTQHRHRKKTTTTKADHEGKHPQQENASVEPPETLPTPGSTVLVDGDFLQCTNGLPVPLYYRDRALLDCAIQNDTLFLSTMNVVDYSLLIGVRDNNVCLSAGIIDYLHPYNFIKRAENLLKDGLHDLKLRSAESTIQKASEYKRRFRAATELYFMALPNDA